MRNQGSIVDESHYVDQKYADGCRRLFAAIIGRAIYDCCLHPAQDRISKKHYSTAIARDAIEFLFLPNEAFDTYMAFLDIDTGNFRRNLLDSMSGKVTRPYFVSRDDSLNARNFRFNYRWTMSETEAAKSAASCVTLTTKPTENTARTAAAGCRKKAAKK